MGDLDRVEARVDYWELTVPFGQREELLSQFPGGVQLRRNRHGDNRGWRGYDHSADLAVGSGLVGWRPDRIDMGCHASLGGTALTLLAGASEEWEDVPSRVDHVHTALEDGGLGGRTTRLDIAFDDKVGLLDMETIKDAVDAVDYTSRYRKRPDEWYSHETGGRTFRWGSSSSDSQLLIYDKLAERLDKGRPEEVEGLTHWVRVEMRIRRERAHAAAEELRTKGQEVWSYFVRILKGMLDFKERGTDSNKTRWRTVGWWDTFLGFASKAQLTVDKAALRLDDVKSYVLGQWASTLALLEKGMGFDQAWAFLYEVAQEGHTRLNPRHKLLLERVEIVKLLGQRLETVPVQASGT